MKKLINLIIMLIMLFTSWRNEETDLIGSGSSCQKRFLLLKKEINKQMKQYAICGEYLNDTEEQLQNKDCNMNVSLI